MQTKSQSISTAPTFRMCLAVAALIGNFGSALAADQTIDLSGGTASFVGSDPLLNGGADVISFANLGAGTYDFLLTISSQYIPDLGATINGQAATVMGSGNMRFAGIESIGDSPFSLTITGTPGLSANYSGEISVAAVPEPQTYALMLAGLAAVGFMARRRRQPD